MDRPKILKTLRVVYLVAAAGFVTWTVVARSDQIGRLLDGTRFVWLLVAWLMSFGMIGWTALLWRQMLTAQGETVTLRTTVNATARALFARYVPGSIWFALGRATLLGRAGVAAGPLAVTAATEIVISIAITIAGGALLLGAVGALPGGALWAIGAAIVLGAAASPTVSGRAIRYIARKRGATIKTISWRSYLGAVSVGLVFWTWAALTFTVYLRAFPLADGIGTSTLVGGFLFAWGVGFLAIIAPQGVGVFEVTLATILVTGGVGETALVIGGYRLIILLRDAVATALAEASSVDPVVE